MSLHYLVKLEMFIKHVLPLSCYIKILHYIHHTSTVAPTSRHMNPLAYSVCGLLQQKLYKYSSLIWTNWNSDWEQSGSSWITSSLRQPFVSVIVGSSRSVMRVLYTFSCNIFHILLSTGFKSGEFGGQSKGGINSW